MGLRCADLGGRAGWLSKAERVKTLFLPYSPKTRGGGGGGVSRLRFPPGPHLRSSRFSRHPRLRQAPTRRFAKNRNNPQSADLEARWMVSEGGAFRVPVFAPAFQPQAPGHLANKPLSPASRQPSRVKNSKNARCSSAHEKPGLLHRLISCAQSHAA